MKKLLIVGNDLLVIQALEGACKAFGFDNIEKCTHVQVIKGFCYHDFSHIIILDYNEDPRLREKEGLNAWGLLKALAKDARKIIRCGYEQYPYPDYIKLPFEPLELKEKLGIAS